MSANPDGSYYGHSHNHHAHHSNHSNHHTHSGSVEEGARVADGNQQAQSGPLLSPWKMRSGHQVTPADFDNPMTSESRTF